MSIQAVHDFILLHWRDALEISLLWFVIYQLWLRLHETRGSRMLIGVIIASVALLAASEILQLPVLEWLLRNIAALGLFTLVVIFQPELRRIAASFGNAGFFSSTLQNPQTAELLCEMAFELVNRRLGGSIAIEREVPLENWADSGVPIDGLISTELGVSMFHHKTPLHDGALIIRGDRVAAAACILPLTDRTDLDRSLGLRHRSALGLTDETDAIVIIVSEETGAVSICHDGKIERGFEPETLKSRLSELLSLPQNETPAD
jgi:diadenylate cyclase